MASSATIEGDYDYIIVGAGPAGCVLANRLSDDPQTRVLLLEAGKHDNYHWIHIPVGYLYCIGNPRTDWMMKTAPEPGLNGRTLLYPRGKVLGGCTSINGMIYMRGQAADYDGWRQMGNKGWGWDDVLPYFRKTEDHYLGASDQHGSGGEWKVSKQRVNWDILLAFQRAAQEFGIHPTDDFNSGTNEGSGFFEVNQNRGVRWNAAKAFLKPVRNRANLRVITEAHTDHILLNGKRAEGVSFRKDGKIHEVRAQREVLLTAGAINSPKILELSGIGRADILSSLGLPIVHALAGVGENLQDHLQLRTVYGVSNALTLNHKANSVLGKLAMGLEYALRRSGPLSMAPSQLGMFSRSDDSRDTPDLEYHVQPLSTDKLGDPVHPYPAITVSVCNLRPESVGSTHTASDDCDVQPDIRLNYLSAESDRIVALKSIGQVRKIMQAEALKRYSPKELLPGPAVTSEKDILHAIGDIGTTIFHPIGTCKMGQDDRAVVNDRLQVHGLDGLRVIDASIMPKIVSGNTASPVVMIAEKAAEMILAGHKAQ